MAGTISWSTSNGSFKVYEHHVYVMILYIMISIGVPVLSVIFATANYEMACDTSPLVHLDYYLLGTAALQFFIILVVSIGIFYNYFCGCCQFCGDDCYCADDINYNKLFRKLLFFESVIYLALAIIGAISLFRYSTSCLDEAPQLWGMTLAVIIYYWFSIGYNFIVGSFYVGAE